MTFSNPLEVVIGGAVVVVGGVAWVIKQVAQSVSSAADAAGKVQSVKHAGTEETRKRELHEAELVSLQLDNLKKAVELSPLLEQIQPEVEEVLGATVPELPPTIRAQAEALKDQAVEATVELEQMGDQSVELRSDGSD